jgi:hypothetical protein
LTALLDNLERALRTLDGFARPPGKRAERIGSGEVRVRSAAVADTGSTTDLEMGRQLLSRFVARQYSQAPGQEPEALIVVGADHLSSDALKRLIDAAQLGLRQLLLVFERISGAGERVLGSLGSTHAVFFRLGNETDRGFASRFLGDSYRFVVSGYSLSVTETRQWSESKTFGIDGSLGATKDFASRLGGSLSLAISKTRSRTDSSGGSLSSATTATLSRVHEPLIEPDAFRAIPDMTMLVVNGDEVVVADCNPRIRTLPTTSRVPRNPAHAP